MLFIAVLVRVCVIADDLVRVRCSRGVTFLLLFTSVTVAASVAQLAQKRYSSLSRRTQELLTKAIEFTRMPRYSVVDATVELNWAKRLRAKDFIAKRNGIYAAQLSRYQRHRHELTAKFFYDRIVHYRIDGKSYIGIADRHAQPEDVRLLSIGGQEISIAEHVSGVLVWDHINYDKRVALKLQDGQYLYASGAVNIPANTDMMYGTVDGVFQRRLSSRQDRAGANQQTENCWNYPTTMDLHRSPSLHY